eukprot:GHVS01081984.1.p1 GENE.GHVS01081984.1~~GHVS01081984.1.p1  ORF type:complete len:120 (-),score=12.98 GHVS01081984.1:336-695(-)
MDKKLPIVWFDVGLSAADLRPQHFLSAVLPTVCFGNSFVPADVHTDTSLLFLRLSCQRPPVLYPPPFRLLPLSLLIPPIMHPVQLASVRLAIVFVVESSAKLDSCSMQMCRFCPSFKNG